MAIEEKYNLKPLTRGQVRECEALAGSDQIDLLVQLSVGESVTIDLMPMPDFILVRDWALKTNGLDGSAVDQAKKN